MADAVPNLGQIAEDWMERICTTTFFADFTIRSPMYQKQGGQTKEAADFLVVFGGTLMIVQLKTKLVDDAESMLGPHDLKRAAAAVDKAMSQFRAMLEAADDPAFFTLVNTRGHALKIEKSDIKNVVALVVYGLVAPDGRFSQTRLRFTQSCFPEDGISVHLFTMQEFSLLTLWSDTFPDFLHYLNVRELLHLKNLIHPETSPEDVWTFATFEPERLLEVIRTNTPINIDDSHAKHIEIMRGWEEAEKPSYFVDWLIGRLYEGIGSQVEVNRELIAKTRALFPLGSLQAYQQTIPKLAMLRRRDRNELAIALAEKVERAQTEKLAFRVTKFESHAEAFIVLAIEGPRPERQAALFNLARAAGYKLGVRYVVGIATAPLPLGSSECDVIIVDIQEMKIDQRLLDAVNYFFGEPQEVIRPPITPPINPLA